MNCYDARKLWNHKGGFIAGLNCKGHGYQDVLPYLTQLAHDFVNRKHDHFDSAVKDRAGGGPYRITHSDGTSDLAVKVHDVIGDAAGCLMVSSTIGKIVGVPTLRFSNVCCNGCTVSDGSLTNTQILDIQMAAVSLNPDGTPIPE